MPAVQLDDTLRARAAAAMVPLQALYHTDTGLFDKNDWWTSGNVLEGVIDYTRETGDQQYVGDIENTFVKNEQSKFERHGFYDDDGWWAIVWIKAYDSSREQKYLDMASTRAIHCGFSTFPSPRRTAKRNSSPTRRKASAA